MSYGAMRSKAPFVYRSAPPWRRAAFIIATEDLVIEYQDVLGPMARVGAGYSNIIHAVVDTGIRYAMQPQAIPGEFERALMLSPAMEVVAGLNRERVVQMIHAFIGRIDSQTRIRFEDYIGIDSVQMTPGHDLMLALLLKVS